MMRHALSFTARLGIARPRLVVVLCAVVTAGALLGLTRLRIATDLGAFLPERVASVQMLRDLSEKAGAKSLYVELERSAVDECVAAVAERLAASPFVEAVHLRRADFLSEGIEAAAEAPLYFLDDGELLRLEETLGPGRTAALEETRSRLAADPVTGKAVALRDPLGIRWLLFDVEARHLPEFLDPSSPYVVTRDRTKAFLRVRGAKPPHDIPYARDLLGDLEARLKVAGVEARMFGGYVFARDDATRMRADLLGATIWSSIFVFVYLAITLRSLGRPLLLIAPTAVAVLWMLGYGGALLSPLNPLAIAAAALLTGLGVDFAIHYAARFAEERARLDLEAATLVTAERTGHALLLGLLTDVGAFLSLGVGSWAGVRAFGLLLALGLVSAYVATLLLMPLLLRRSTRWSAAPGPVTRAADAFARSRAALPTALVVGLAGIAGWGVVAAVGLRVTADPRELRPAHDALAVAEARLREDLGFSPSPVTALVPLDHPLERLGAAIDGLRASGVVRLDDGPHRVVQTAAARERVARFRERTRGWADGCRADMARLGLRPEPFAPALAELERRLAGEPSADLSAFRLDVGGTSFHRVSLFLPPDHRDRPDLHAVLQDALGADVRLLDFFAVSDEVTPILRRELRTAALVAALVTATIVLVGLRSVRAAACALAPVAVGLGATFGGVALLRAPIHPGNLVALPFLLGLGVDFGIYMTGRALEGDRRPLLTTGDAILRTSVTTLLAFGSLAFASSPALVSLGCILAAGISACYVATVLLVPQLLSRWR